MPNRGRSRTGAGLFAVYAAASLVPVCVLGAALVRGYHEDGIDQALAQGRDQATVIERMAIAPALSGEDLSLGLSRDERDRLRSATDLALYQGSVEHLRLISFAGGIAFADDGRSRGAVPVDDPSFRAATAGKVDARIVDEDGTGGAAPVIRVLLPVKVDTNGRAVGLLEVHLPYEAIAARVAEETRGTVLRLTFGLLGLYGVLALISWWTTRALRRHAAAHEHQALHDPLTGLPNRELFHRETEDALTHSRRGDRGALVLIDLDHFKEVNDTLGHHAGDELLRIVARRLEESVRSGDTVARLGGDEFGVLLPGGGDRAETVALVARVREELAREVTLDGTTLSIEASFGVCFYPDDARSVEGLLQHADAAMYRGKHGAAGVVVYEPAVTRPATDALVMQRELRQALMRDEFVVVYQPKIELRSGRVDGVEALLRWQHPSHGLLGPGEFLAVAERSDLIEPLTRWVLRQALSDYTAWTRDGRDWTLAVNVSARNLSSLDFADDVADLLENAGVGPDRLHLEVTETALALDWDTAGEVVVALAAQGIAVSIDDFGIGYTGLSQLRTLDVAEIKVDRSFISRLADSAPDRAIVQSVIDLAHRLGCVVTAEGVEEPEIVSWLVEAGCDYGQGYLWRRPGPWQDIEPIWSGATVPLSASGEAEHAGAGSLA